MRKKKILKKHILIPALGVIMLIAIAVFCYSSVERTIIGNEQEGLKGLAKVNAQSMESSLMAKRDLIFAMFSDDMASEEEIETALVKIGEKGNYISVDDIAELVEKTAVSNPWEVVIGPVAKSEEGFYELRMTKAVSVEGRISGVIQIDINLDEFYAEEQALSSLEVENNRYCIVKDRSGEIIMPSEQQDNAISISHTTGSGCTIEWVYDANGVTPERTRKLIAYETIKIGTEELYLYIVEDYDLVTQPIERVALYFCLIGCGLLAFVVAFMRKLNEQQRKELVLENELQHEKMLNETMKKQEGLMQKYNHSKTMSVLTGSIAHEFNNLMTPIVLYAELLEESDVVREEFLDEVTELKSTAYRCEELAKQLLSYSRQGRAEKVLTDYDATYAVREAVSMIRKLLPDKVSLKENVCKTSYLIHGQVGALNQIILNLATNAFHAMKEGGVLKISFGLSTEDDRYVRLIIEDTGTGIPLEVQRKVFQPFFTTKKAGEGTGIGLTVVKRLTEEHGGIIRAQSTEGEGTTFILDFPRVME